MTSPRAVRYRKLALVERDSEKAELLRLLADEADQGILFTVEYSRHNKSQLPPAQTGPYKAMTEVKIARITPTIPRGTIICKGTGGPPLSEAEHFHKCEACGGWFDMRDFGAVLGHDEPLPHPVCGQISPSGKIQN
jgi:hypothetical protein